MNNYDKLKKVKSDLETYNYDLMKYMNEGFDKISIKKVQARILRILEDVIT